MMDSHYFQTHLGTKMPAPKPGYPIDSLDLDRFDGIPEVGKVRNFPGGGVTIRSRAGYEVFFKSPDMDYISIGLDSNGEILSSYNGDAVQIRTKIPGRMHYHPAGSTVYARYEGGGMQLVTVAIQANMRRELLKQMGADDFILKPIGDLKSPMGEQLAQRLRQFVLMQEDEAPLVAESLAKMVLYEALVAITGKVRDDEIGGSNQPEADPLQRVIQFIDANLHRDVSLNEIAGIACKSPFHFARTFKDAMGITPVAYVIAKRIERSKNMLRHTDLPISIIASKCGFNSQSHYCRTFRRLERQSPRQFRRTR